jgi:hypothetical protein
MAPPVVAAMTWDRPPTADGYQPVGRIPSIHGIALSPQVGTRTLRIGEIWTKNLSQVLSPFYQQEGGIGVNLEKPSVVKVVQPVGGIVRQCGEGGMK